jgi:hypothetical protein
MINKDTQISLRNVIEKIVYAAIIGMAIFLWKVNAKQDTIVTNQRSIQQIWQKYSEMDTRLDNMNHELGTLKGRHIE